MGGNRLNDYEKAKKLLENKKIKQAEIARQAGISYNTLRVYSKDHEKLRVASWKNVHELAKIYDRVKKVL